MQQRIGIRADEVRRDSTSNVLRVPGRIAVDDQRLYRIIAAVDGSILDLRENTAGRFVKKDQVLASYYTRDLLSTERNFLLSIPANEPLQTQARDFSQASIRTAGSANPQFPIDSLRGLGMSDLQIEEIHRARAAAPHVNIYSPVSGFVLARNISPRQRFDKGTELYRIADISRVWVMTDIFEKDRQFVKPGAEATIFYQGRRLKARMTDALPQFDAQSRTLKTRFELDNPGYVLQPDMFVDVELDVHMPPAITVPADAVFDSGLRKTVFIDRGDGGFEARRVEIGWRLGDRVEITRGLMEGERVVAAANFLLDSESRMRAASAGIFNPASDLVCGMDVDGKKAAAAELTVVHEGHTYSFCSADCKRKFQEDPARYTTTQPQDGHRHESPSPGTSPARVPAASKQASAGAEASRPVKDLVCGMDVDPKEAAAAGRTVEHGGKVYYFCSDDCKAEFAANPAAYLKAAGDGR
jgi:RND family efflux transporter MFP subunit